MTTPPRNWFYNGHSHSGYGDRVVLKTSRYIIRRSSTTMYQYQVHMLEDKYRGRNDFIINCKIKNDEVVVEDVTNVLKHNLIGMIIQVQPRIQREIIDFIRKDFIKFITMEAIKGL